MIYEWRVYDIVPGKKKSLNDRFANHTAKLFEKHGVSIVGFWENSVGGRSNSLYYMLAFKNMEHLETAWREFSADPEWQAVVSESEKDGPLVANITNIILKPTYYSPMR